MDATETSPTTPRDATLPDLQERGRVIVERIWPEIDGGRFPIRRSVGEQVTVSVDIFADGHELLAGVVKYRHVPAGRPARGHQGSAEPAPQRASHLPGPKAVGRVLSDPPEQSAAVGRVLSDPPEWQEVPLIPRDNDRWEGTFRVTELGEYEYTVEAWIDRFGSWLKGLVAKAEANQDVSSELLEGAELVQQAAAPHGPPEGGPYVRHGGPHVRGGRLQPA